MKGRPFVGFVLAACNGPETSGLNGLSRGASRPQTNPKLLGSSVIAKTPTLKLQAGRSRTRKFARNLWAFSTPVSCSTLCNTTLSHFRKLGTTMKGSCMRFGYVSNIYCGFLRLQDPKSWRVVERR